MLTDIEIAKSVKMRPINEVAAELGIHEDQVENYGRYIAKITTDKIDTNKFKNHHLILVTAISPTKAGNGKTTVSVGLALGMQKIGKKSVVALREPSLGPCFGMKGGAAGGGYAQLVPMDKINLHFTGDFHAITEANNMISALLDNYRFQHEAEGFKLKKILWRRVMDVNDRGLRRIITGIGDKNGIETESGFDITPASEIMAIMCFATSIDDLRRRIDNILLGITEDDKPFTVKDMGVGGSIVALLLDALKPNLVQTTEGTPAFVHCGPFANIAHGCNSVMATAAALEYGDYAITEAGFGRKTVQPDLGAEKIMTSNAEQDRFATRPHCSRCLHPPGVEDAWWCSSGRYQEAKHRRNGSQTSNLQELHSISLWQLLEPRQGVMSWAFSYENGAIIS